MFPHLTAGAAQSGRSIQNFYRSTCLRCSADADRATALERARRGIAEYGQYPVHQAQYALYGFNREAEVRVAFALGDTAAALAAVSEAMIDMLGLAGTPDDVRRASTSGTTWSSRLPWYRLPLASPSMKSAPTAQQPSRPSLLGLLRARVVVPACHRPSSRDSIWLV